MLMDVASIHVAGAFCNERAPSALHPDGNRFRGGTLTPVPGTRGGASDVFASPRWLHVAPRRASRSCGAGDDRAGRGGRRLRDPPRQRDHAEPQGAVRGAVARFSPQPRQEAAQLRAGEGQRDRGPHRAVHAGDPAEEQGEDPPRLPRLPRRAPYRSGVKADARNPRMRASSPSSDPVGASRRPSGTAARVGTLSTVEQPLHRALGLTDGELDRIRELLERDPNHFELAVFSCSGRSTAATSTRPRSCAGCPRTATPCSRAPARTPA